VTTRTGDFQITSATRVAQAGFLGVDDVRVTSPEGDELSRVVVRHPGAVVVVPVLDGGTHALAVRQYRAACHGWVLEVPAGKRDVLGEAPELTAARELEEEVGKRAGRLLKLCEFWNTPGFCDEYTHLYAALDLVDVGGPAATSAEEQHMTIESIAFADVDRLIAERELVDAKTIIGLLLTRAHLSGAG
jgi:ADP-ribose pyrophosphatase